ncbi:molybdopterin-guanine dinucleotide biosynthesis protein B [Marinicrinis sediminis]|uniref:Molybdopterin-guanine dinucleotide biosynthesis protein B n=1 Tax=Marinicrinis sediminis TaxID=1652465 RepID=A0ABW5R5L0_9BACL
MELQLVGFSNSGKTTLIQYLTRELTKQGYRIGVIKHHHLPVPLDTPGKDSTTFLAAGAKATALLSPLEMKVQVARPYSLREMIANMYGVYGALDLLFIEGFKTESLPKLLLVRTKEEYQQLKTCLNIQGVAVWPTFKCEAHLLEGRPLFSVQQPEDLLIWVQQRLHQEQSSRLPTSTKPHDARDRTPPIPLFKSSESPVEG